MDYKVMTVRGVKVGPRRMQQGVCTDPGFRFVEDHFADERLGDDLCILEGDTEDVTPAVLEKLRKEGVTLKFRGWRLELLPDGSWRTAEGESP